MRKIDKLKQLHLDAAEALVKCEEAKSAFESKCEFVEAKKIISETVYQEALCQKEIADKRYKSELLKYENIMSQISELCPPVLTASMIKDILIEETEN